MHFPGSAPGLSLALHGKVLLLRLSSLPELAGPGSDDAISVRLVPQISIHRLSFVCHFAMIRSSILILGFPLVLFPSIFPSRAVLNSEFPRSI